MISDPSIVHPNGSGVPLVEEPKPVDGAPSNADTQPDQQAECRICLMNDDPLEMVKPCSCQGTLQFAHLKCLKLWVREKSTLSCEICRSPYSDQLFPALQSEVGRHLSRASVTVRIIEPGESFPPEPARRRCWPSIFNSWPFWIGVSAAVLTLTVTLLAVITKQPWAGTMVKVLVYGVMIGLPGFIIMRAIFTVLASLAFERRSRMRENDAQEPHQSNV